MTQSWDAVHDTNNGNYAGNQLTKVEDAGTQQRLPHRKAEIFEKLR